uniref:Uncharacterized protein n=1 Tax=Aplanochytrium stocchinoi TaxID=215587 RepID=A0A7S3LMJ9_9STRA|mmetsp:Transcript_2077/g.2760  ORF Transcript_2077/g.2760 Transcript_2077/m.2760 type:complete len:148 (-) Transcript_2077:259-702(-)
MEGKHQQQDSLSVESRFTTEEFRCPSTSDYFVSTVKHGKSWETGPKNPEGMLFDASNMPLLCSAVSPSGTECVVGGSDHGLRVFDVICFKARKNETYTPSKRVIQTGLLLLPTAQMVQYSVQVRRVHICILFASIGKVPSSPTCKPR